MTSTYPIGTFGSVASFLAAIICRCDRNSTRNNIFPNTQAISNNCTYCRYMYIYLYCFFFSRKFLYSLWLYTKSYSVLSLTTSLSLYYVVITCTFCLFKSISHPHGLIYKSQYGDNQLQAMTTKMHTYKCGEDLCRTLG